jgi:ATP adenylyltransferase
MGSSTDLVNEAQLVRMSFDILLQFIERDMRMSHVYQPIMIRELLDHAGHASREQIARALLNEDLSQLEYYCEITRDMVGRVLCSRNIVKRDDRSYQLIGYEAFTPEQVQRLKAACEKRLAEYVERRGQAIWDHRRASPLVSGTLRYEVLKEAGHRCELCGIPNDVRTLQVDHITPRNHGGTNERANLQALCYVCNASRRDRDDTDFRKVKMAYQHRDPHCPFCADKLDTVLENRLARLVKDAFPVTQGHLLAIPKRHAADYFDLGTAEIRACQHLIEEGRARLTEDDPSIEGFNVGINCGSVAGQTIMHAHVHLIPRRKGDSPNPRGGVRGVIAGKADYLSTVPTTQTNLVPPP